MQRRALADPLGDVVGNGKDLVGLFVQQQMIVAEMGPLTCQWKFLVLR